MKAFLVECSDYDQIYGIIEVKGIDSNTVQGKIYEIKHRFYDEGKDDWTIEDVLAEFPEEWDWSYDQLDPVIEI